MSKGGALGESSMTFRVLLDPVFPRKRRDSREVSCDERIFIFWRALEHKLGIDTVVLLVSYSFGHTAVIAP